MEMVEISFFIIGIISLMSFIILVFIYSAISTDTLTVIICIILFLFLLIPFLATINQLELMLIELNLKNLFIFKWILNFSIIINIFIGLYLFIELFYTAFFN